MCGGCEGRREWLVGKTVVVGGEEFVVLERQQTCIH